MRFQLPIDFKKERESSGLIPSAEAHAVHCLLRDAAKGRIDIDFVSLRC